MIDNKKLVKFLKQEIKLTKLEIRTELKSRRYGIVAELKGQLDTYIYILNKIEMRDFIGWEKE